MKGKSRKMAAAVASFGAALSSIYLSPSAEADVLDLSGNLPGSLPYNATSASITFDFVPGATIGSDFFQWNDSIGKTFNVNGGGDIKGFIFVSPGNVITTGMAFSSSLTYSAGASGVQTFGFNTAANEVGWIRFDFGGLGGDIIYLSAAYNRTPGQHIRAGQFVVPEPSAFGLTALAGLALGAAGVRRMRRQKVAA